jgi:simple sugar transport system ATP-binding protein
MLAASQISKRYGSLVALDDVSVSFAPSEIHAVLGENGAGKSTLMGVLSGFIKPDSGNVSLGGNSVPLGHPNECRRMGIEMIHQHFTLVPEFTVEENLALARLPGLGSALDVRTLATPALETGKRLGWDLSPSAKVRSLPVGVQQRIEILKALSADAPVMIFDEPTAVLSPEEVEELFRVLRELRAQGRTVILIAHKLREVMSVADRATVLRLGRLIGSAPLTELDEATLSKWIVGDLPEPKKRSAAQLGRTPITFESVTVLGDRGQEAVRNVSLELRPGEILGIGGVDGNGQVELAEFLAGVRLSTSHASGAVGAVAYIPQDRQGDGLALNMSVQDNMLVTGQRIPELTEGPFLQRRAIRDWAQQLIRRFDIRVSGPEERVGSLSGGNQQKVVVSRSLAEQPSLVIAVNPTRGLDLKATLFVREQIVAARDAGAAVALFTTDLDELFEVADRHLFMSGGKLLAADRAEAMLGS